MLGAVSPGRADRDRVKLPRKVCNDSPVPGVRDVPGSLPRRCGRGRRRRSSDAHPGPDTQDVAWVGLLPQYVQVRAGRPDLLALDLDDRLGRARHQGTEQRQVRALEQCHLLRRSARSCSDVRHPHLPAELGPAAAGLPRTDPDVLLCSQPDSARRPEGPHAFPPG